SLAFQTTEPCVLSVEPEAVWMVVPRVGLRRFGFRRVLHDRVDQEQVYERAAAGVVGAFLNGADGSVFCYGQTGSGKTHTMFGASAAQGTQLTK
ncbi:unnamed protein product, partial [Heterosigma akashiwo]